MSAAAELRRPGGALWTFGAVLAGLAALDVALRLVVVPDALAAPAGLLVTALYVAAPVFALYAAAAARWRPALASGFLVGGIALQVAMWLLARRLAPTFPLGALAALGVGQGALLCWCVGLGALLATLVSDRNMLLPICIVLAATDVFVVLSPIGPARRMLAEHPEVFASVAYAVPRVATRTTGVLIGPEARIGPADMFFLGMFFVALHRFGMRTRATLIAVAPTLVAYLLVVLLLGWVRLGPIQLDALPALVPIGAVVVAVNWREFSMSPSERRATIAVAAAAVVLVAWGATRKPAQASPSAPSRSAPGRAPSRSGG